ncbi:MAG: PLP-dependent aminotransferase family protein [Peptostreptococcaceae bacterium]|nr:PLP-dependent aminotransferase family protein [Peptostreptococcaceae bacterium]
MKQIMPMLVYKHSAPLYLQLYTYIKENILDGSIRRGEKLPSLRALSKSIEISITTVGLAYDQLLVEGYIFSKPGSGYFINEIASGMGTPLAMYASTTREEEMAKDSMYYYDSATFDFAKWKKCTNQVLTEYAHLLFHEGDSQGEMALRNEISKYVYQSRGVICNPDQIVIGAGTQQITGQLSNILSMINIKNIILEDPCYLPVKNIFRDRGFTISQIPVGKEGISLSHLPEKLPCAVYVSPSNQFPTGAVIPVGKRYELLSWAQKNGSIIIEDDYDSELRYFGRPIPALQGLDTNQRVVYLGSFSSTLFASVKISYMILPEFMANIFQGLKRDYSQTCSKMEQLTLSLFMGKGQYQIGIKKLRALCSQKLNLATGVLVKKGSGFITLTNTSSGVNLILNVKSEKSSAQLCLEGASLGIQLSQMSFYSDKATYTAPSATPDTFSDATPSAPQDTSPNVSSLILHFNQIPIDKIPSALEALIELWQKDTRF